MIKQVLLLLTLTIFTFSCSEDLDDNAATTVAPRFIFTHHWNNSPVTSTQFNNFNFTTEHGENISIERLRYIISDISFTTTSGEIVNTNIYNLVDLTNNQGLDFSLSQNIPIGNYSNVSFTFGLDNEDNALNYPDLNSASFNVPDMLGGGYHYMQFDGKFINNNNEAQGFNYHAIRAVNNPGMNPSFPQDTFFTVDLGPMFIGANTNITVEANIAEWFKNPNLWDLNQYNQMLMPNATAQILMYENGQSVFNLATAN